MANFTPRTSEYYPKSIHAYKTFIEYAWNHYAPETDGNCTWFAFGETSRIVQECLADESYNIQYTYGNEFMSAGPSALYWMQYTASKGAWSTDGDARGNYNPSGSSLYGTQILISPGDILCYWSPDGFGHVEIAERVENGYIYCSGSKASVQQAAVLYYTRTVAASQFTVGRQHTFSGEAADGTIISWSNDYFQGVIHNPYVSETPTPGTETPDVEISPSSYTKTMSSSETFLDFIFTITVTGIPVGESASSGTTYSGLTRRSNGSGWVYSTYTVNGVTYQRATKTGMILRYTREMNGSYSTTKYLIFDKTFSNGRAYFNTPIHINVNKHLDLISILTGFRKRKRGRIDVTQI